jgi:hypothetical protein
MECGFSIDDFSDFKPDDIIECCKIEHKFKSLVVHQQNQEVKYGQQHKEGANGKYDDEEEDA